MSRHAPGKLTPNGFIESLSGKLHDKCLNPCRRQPGGNFSMRAVG